MSCSQFRSQPRRDECLVCGKTASEHGVELPPAPVSLKQQGIKILFGGKFYEFKDWQEARKRGFYLY